MYLLYLFVSDKRQNSWTNQA